MKPIKALVGFIVRHNNTLIAACSVLALLGCIATILSCLWGTAY